MKIIPSDNRYFSDMGWLKTYHLFSFADYVDYNNMNRWALRVFNDDFIEGKTWFPMHPHSNMEIVTIMLDGELTHTDSMWNKEVLTKDWIQITSAGYGIYHSEMNNWSNPVHLYQIWIQPSKVWISPNYANIQIDSNNYLNNLYPVVSWEWKSENIIVANWTIYRSKLESGRTLNYTTHDWRFVFIYVYKGSITINGNIINENYQFRDYDTENFDINAVENSEFILIDSFI